jgi:O-antigen/teichoic acid export membrane protein
MGYSLANTVLFYGLRVLALVVVVWLGMGSDGIIIGWSVAHLLAPVFLGTLLLVFLRRQDITLQWSSGHERDILGYGVYLALPFISIYLTPSLLNMIMGWLSTTEDVASLTICLSLASLTFVILTPISSVLLPAVSKAFADKEWQHISDLGSSAFKYLWLLGFCALSLTTFLGDKLILWIYGTGYEDAPACLRIMAFATFFESVKTVTDPLLNGTTYARAVTKIEILKLFLILLLGISLIHYLGLRGAGLALLIAYSISTFLKTYHVQKILAVNLCSIMLRFIPLILALVLFAYLDWPIWLFALLAVAIIVHQRMLPSDELRALVSLFMNAVRSSRREPSEPI